MRVAVLDADVIAYIAAADAADYVAVEWGDGVTTSDSRLEKAKLVVDTTVDRWAEAAQADGVLLAFSGKSELNFRRDVHPEYKMNRTAPKPEGYETIVEWMKDAWEYQAYDNLEGDDVIGMLVSGPPDIVQYIGVSTDKDLKTLPGEIVYVNRGEYKHMVLSEHDANWWWMMQTLMGDRVDNFKGAPGVGVKAAEKALGSWEGLQAMWYQVTQAYGRQWEKPPQRAKFITSSPYREALMNARCARILRDGDYNFDTGEVTLWTP